MRAALLPTPGDPFMLAYWLRNYATWKQHVDELVVFVNGQRDQDALSYDRRIVEEAGGRFFSQIPSAGHDGALRFLLDATGADTVVLCEDDAYVRRPEAVGEAFSHIESGQTDIIGSPRHEDYFGQTQEWGPFDPQDQAEFRHGLWPAFLFIRRADIQATDRIFGDRRWNIGERIAGLERVVTKEDCEYVGIAPDYIHLDTLFGTTFQLRHLRIELVHHVRLFDAKATEEWIAEDPPWFHVTGLSTLSDVLNHEMHESVAYLPDLDAQGGLWTRRMAWWMWMYLTADSELILRWDRGHVLEDFIQEAGIPASRIRDWSTRINAWVTWADDASHVPVTA